MLTFFNVCRSALASDRNCIHIFDSDVFGKLLRHLRLDLLIQTSRLLSRLRVDFSEAFRLLVRLPVQSVVVGIIAKLLHLWHNLTDDNEEGTKDELEEAWLTFRDLSRLTVTEERHWQAFLLLNIALVEELLEEELGPLERNLEWSRLR